MLTDESSNLNLDDISIDLKFDVQTRMPLIPSTDWRNSNDDQHISKGKIINKKQHESRLEDLVSDQNLKLQDLLESYFSLEDMFKRKMNGSLQLKSRKLYSSPKTLLK